MAVKRIVANIAADDLQKAVVFYQSVLGLRMVMDHGWIMTFAGENTTAPQISFASEGGGGAPIPDVSIEVDDFDDVLSRMIEKGFTLQYGPVIESWGVRRMFVRDPFGRLINILTHEK